MPEREYSNESEARSVYNARYASSQYQNVELTSEGGGIFSSPTYTVSWEEADDEDDSGLNDPVPGAATLGNGLEDSTVHFRHPENNTPDPDDAESVLELLREVIEENPHRINIRVSHHTEIRVEEVYESGRGRVYQRYEDVSRSSGVNIIEISSDIRRETRAIEYTIDPRYSEAIEEMLSEQNFGSLGLHNVVAEPEEGSEPTAEEVREKLDFNQDNLGTGRYKIRSKSNGLGRSNELNLRAVDHSQGIRMEVDEELYERFEEGDTLYFENGYLKGKQKEVTI